MSSANNVLVKIACRQYLYKLKAFSFLGLIVTQVVALLFSYGGVGMSGMGTNQLSLTVRNYSSDFVIIFTMFWAFIMAISYTKKHAKSIDFTLISSRLSSSLSDLSVFITISVLGALTSTLSGMFLRLFFYFTADHGSIINSSFKLPFSAWLQSFLAVTLYLLLVCSAGYLFGMLMEVNKIFGFIIPVLLFGLLRAQNEIFLNMIQFFNESSLLIFAGKTFLATAVLWSLSMLLFNRMEVRL